MYFNHNVRFFIYAIVLTYIKAEDSIDRSIPQFLWLTQNKTSEREIIERSNKLVINVIDYINDFFTSPEINTIDIAKDFFVSEGHLSRLFRKYTGTTVYNYIIQKRLSYSITLFWKGDAIQDACYKSGFTDYTSYLKAFKKTYHLTPSQYKNSTNNLNI